VQTALENSSPADIVQFSEAALQLQEAGGLFGTTGTANPTTNLDGLLQSLESSTASGSTPGATTLAAYQSALQAQQADALFGTSTTSGTSGALGTSGISLLG
jgi:hypothetical protein